mgnify:CR=1 FL=1
MYLVDRTIPMLPERLCNFICSLRPDEEKLAYSVIFNMNEKAEIKDYRIRHTVIKSNRRFTYEEKENEPFKALNCPTNVFNKVDFPMPLKPVITTFCPPFTVKLISDKTG